MIDFLLYRNSISNTLKGIYCGTKDWEAYFLEIVIPFIGKERSDEKNEQFLLGYHQRGNG